MFPVVIIVAVIFFNSAFPVILFVCLFVCVFIVVLFYGFFSEYCTEYLVNGSIRVCWYICDASELVENINFNANLGGIFRGSF